MTYTVPVNPGLHEQLNWLIPSTQLASFRHGLLAHSLWFNSHTVPATYTTIRPEMWMEFQSSFNDNNDKDNFINKGNRRA